eukprot:6315514-Prymnesium_polylepis.2
MAGSTLIWRVRVAQPAPDRPARPGSRPRALAAPRTRWRAPRRVRPRRAARRAGRRPAAPARPSGRPVGT